MKYCPECGYPLDKGTEKFCSECGEKLGQKVVAGTERDDNKTGSIGIHDTSGYSCCCYLLRQYRLYKCSILYLGSRIQCYWKVRLCILSFTKKSQKVLSSVNVSTTTK